jgi:RNA polymerase sigma factor (sigma-70 family)
MTELNDQILLSRYLRGADDAFRHLLDRHSGLVYGTALRVTGDPGAAEEVSQDVFVLLARKARALTSHPSVAGWLHRTSHNVARHEQRRRMRRSRKVARIAEEIEEAQFDTPRALTGVDEAVARLPKLDREAILLRFFEDLEYEEIARRIGITESAARKRVSRALKRLQKTLGPEQSSAAASGAMVIAAPLDLLDKIAPALPSAGTAAATTTTTTLLTTMTTSTAVKATGLALVGGLLIYGNVHQSQKNKALTKDLEGARTELSALRGPDGSRKSATRTGENGGERKAGSMGSLARLSAQVGTLTSALEKERVRRTTAESEAASLREQLVPFKDELVVAFGTIEEIGRDFGSLFSEAQFLTQMEKEGRLDEEEVKRRLAKFYRSAVAMGGLSQQVVEMEGDPKEGSEFFSATYAQLFGLEDADRENLRMIFEKHITVANERKISLKQITALIDQDIEGGFEEEMKRMMATRQIYFRDVRAELREAIPEDRRAEFDTWVEQDGIGFNNVTLRGQALLFSLGGNQEQEKPTSPEEAPPETEPARAVPE